MDTRILLQKKNRVLVIEKSVAKLASDQINDYSLMVAKPLKLATDLKVGS